MALPRHIFAPAFRQRQLGWSYALMIGIMVYFATFAVAGEAVLSMTSFTWDKNMANRVTIEIPAVDDESSTPQADRVKQTLSTLKGMPAIASATSMPEEETARLLKPWIGQADLLKELPVPALIEVERKNSISAADIQNALKGVVGDVRVEDHAVWMSGLISLTHGLSVLAGLIIVLTGITLILTVGLLCRTVMAAEHEAIGLLHTMGANDKDIAQHFQFHARHAAIPAAFTGFGLAIITAGPLIFLLRYFIDLVVLQPTHWFALLLLMLLAPLSAIWITAMTARASAFRYLQSLS